MVVIDDAEEVSANRRHRNQPTVEKVLPKPPPVCDACACWSYSKEKAIWKPYA
jgi:hypothetical protein